MESSRQHKCRKFLKRISCMIIQLYEYSNNINRYGQHLISRLYYLLFRFFFPGITVY